MTTQFVPTPEHRTIDEWMADSDYWPSDACGGWLDAEGNEVDPLAQWLGAMEAAGTEYLVVEVDVESGAYRLLDHDGAHLATGSIARNHQASIGFDVAELYAIDTAVYYPKTEKPTRAEYLAKKHKERTHAS